MPPVGNGRATSGSRAKSAPVRKKGKGKGKGRGSPSASTSNTKANGRNTPPIATQPRTKGLDSHLTGKLIRGKGAKVEWAEHRSNGKLDIDLHLPPLDSDTSFHSGITSVAARNSEKQRQAIEQALIDDQERSPTNARTSALTNQAKHGRSGVPALQVGPASPSKMGGLRSVHSRGVTPTGQLPSAVYPTASARERDFAQQRAQLAKGVKEISDPARFSRPLAEDKEKQRDEQESSTVNAGRTGKGTMGAMPQWMAPHMRITEKLLKKYAEQEKPVEKRLRDIHMKLREVEVARDKTAKMMAATPKYVRTEADTTQHSQDFIKGNIETQGQHTQAERVEALERQKARRQDKQDRATRLKKVVDDIQYEKSQLLQEEARRKQVQADKFMRPPGKARPLVETDRQVGMRLAFPVRREDLEDGFRILDEVLPAIKSQSPSLISLNRKDYLALMSSDLEVYSRPMARKLVIFISSTATDCREELAAFQWDVFPWISLLGNALRITVEVVDVSQMTTAFHADNHSAVILRDAELRRALRYSMGLAMVMTLGHTMGPRALPPVIEGVVLETLIEILEEEEFNEEAEVLRKWYSHRPGSEEDVYSLKDITDIIPDYGVRASGHDEWIEAQDELKHALLVATSFLDNDQVRDRYLPYLIERDLELGIGVNIKSRSQVYAIRRSLTGMEAHAFDDGADDFIDVLHIKPGVAVESRLNREAQERLREIKETVLPARVDKVSTVTARWSRRGIDTANVPMHRKYMKQVADGLCVRLQNELLSLAKTIPPRDPVFEEVLEHRNFMLRLHSSWVGDRGVITKIMSYLHTKGDSPLVLSGAPGSGLTTIIGTAATEARVESVQSVRTDEVIAVRFCGRTDQSRTVSALLRSLCQQIMLAYHDREVFTLPVDFKELMESFIVVMGYASVRRPLYIFLDGLDHIHASEVDRDFRWIPHALPPNVRLVVTTRADSRPLAALQTRDYPRQQYPVVPPYRFISAMALLNQRLKAAKKSIPKEFEEKVTQAVKNNLRPLSIRLISDAIVEWGSDMDEVLAATTLDRVVTLRVERIHRLVGAEYMKAALGYISASRYGLSVTELEDLLSCNETVLAECSRRDPDGSILRRVPSSLWVQLRTNLAGYLGERTVSGMIVWSWESHALATLISETFLDDDFVIRCRNDLLKYFAGDRYHERIRYTDANGQLKSVERRVVHQPLYYAKANPNVRQTCEVTYQLLKLRQLEGLIDECLSSLEFIQAMCESGLYCDLVGDFADVKEAQAKQMHVKRMNSMKGLKSSKSLMSLGSNSDLDSSPPQKRTMFSSPSTEKSELLPGSSPIFLSPKLKESSPKLKRSLSPAQQGLVRSQSTLAKVTRAQLVHEYVRFVTNQGRVLLYDPAGTIQVALQQPNSSDIAQRAQDIIHEQMVLTSTSRQYMAFRNKSDLPDPCQLTCSGHDRAISSVVIDDQGLNMVTGSRDHTCKVWHTGTGVCLQTLRGHSDVVTCVQMSVDGDDVYTASFDKTIRLWDWRGGWTVRRFKGHSGPVTSISLLGKRLVSGSHDRTVRLWDTTTGMELQCSQLAREANEGNGHTDIITAVAWSPNGSVIASCAYDRTIKIWNSRDLALIQTLRKHSGPVSCLAWRDNHQLASGSFDCTIGVWDVPKGELVRLLEGHVRKVTSLTYSDTGRLASASADRTIATWATKDEVLADPSRSKMSLIFTGHSAPVNCVVWTPGRTLISGAGDRLVKEWDTRGSGGRVVGHSSKATALVVAPSGLLAASASLDGSIIFWYMVESREKSRIPAAHRGPILTLAFSGDSTLVLSGGADWLARLWQPDGDCLVTFSGHSGVVNCVQFVGHRKFVTGSADRTVRLWDFKGRQTHCYVMEGPLHLVIYMEVAHNMIAATQAGELKMWNLTTSRDLMLVQGGPRLIATLSPVDSVLAISMPDCTVQLRNLRIGNTIHELQAHTAEITGIVFNQTGTLIATCSEDTTVRIWTTETGKCKHLISEHTDRVNSMAFYDGGQTLVTCARDATVRWYSLANGSVNSMFYTSHPASIVRCHHSRAITIIADAGGTVYISAPVTKIQKGQKRMRQRSRIGMMSRTTMADVRREQAYETIGNWIYQRVLRRRQKSTNSRAMKVIRKHLRNYALMRRVKKMNHAADILRAYLQDQTGRVAFGTTMRVFKSRITKCQRLVRSWYQARHTIKAARKVVLLKQFNQYEYNDLQKMYDEGNYVLPPTIPEGHKRQMLFQSLERRFHEHRTEHGRNRVHMRVLHTPEEMAGFLKQGRDAIKRAQREARRQTKERNRRYTTFHSDSSTDSDSG